MPPLDPAQIIVFNRNGLRRRDAPRKRGPAEMLYNRWKRWSGKGIFIRMMEGQAAPQAAGRKTIMIDATPAFADAGSTSKRTVRRRACG